MSVALILCLNIGVDPPDVVKVGCPPPLVELKNVRTVTAVYDGSVTVWGCSLLRSRRAHVWSAGSVPSPCRYDCSAN